MRDFSKPHEVTPLDVAFGAADRIRDLMPSRDELPEDFRHERHPLCDLMQTMFFKGAVGWHIVEKPGINRDAALRHLRAVMSSWEPEHNTKINACAYLVSLWFDKFEPAERHLGNKEGA